MLSEFFPLITIFLRYLIIPVKENTITKILLLIQILVDEIFDVCCFEIGLPIAETKSVYPVGFPFFFFFFFQYITKQCKHFDKLN